MNKFKAYAIVAIISAMGLVSSASYSEIVVIVHPTNHNHLSEKDISRIFLGTASQFPDGTHAIPIDQNKIEANYAQFVKSILKKSKQQINEYWAQQLFSGKATPPREMGSSKNIKKLVAENPALIGYIDAQDVDSTIRVVHRN